MSEAKQTEKLFYKHDEVCRRAQISHEVLEKWEREFDFLYAGYTASGQRVYRKKDLDIVLRLKELFESQKFTHAGARRIIEEEFSVKKKVSVPLEQMKKVLFNIREQLKELSSSLDKKRS